MEEKTQPETDPGLREARDHRLRHAGRPDACGSSHELGHAVRQRRHGVRAAQPLLEEPLPGAPADGVRGGRHHVGAVNGTLSHRIAAVRARIDDALAAEPRALLPARLRLALDPRDPRHLCGDLRPHAPAGRPRHHRSRSQRLGRRNRRRPRLRAARAGRPAPRLGRHAHSHDSSHRFPVSCAVPGAPAAAGGTFHPEPRRHRRALRWAIHGACLGRMQQRRRAALARVRKLAPGRALTAAMCG